MIQNEKARRNYRRDDQKEGCYKMNDIELRKTIGSRAKARRKELGLTMDYLAEKLDVNKSTIMRYSKGWPMRCMLLLSISGARPMSTILRLLTGDCFR